jgi:hypothetical protein
VHPADFRGSGECGLGSRRGSSEAPDKTILVSSDFARALGDGVVSLALHHLRSLATPHELFAPAQ